MLECLEKMTNNKKINFYKPYIIGSCEFHTDTKKVYFICSNSTKFDYFSINNRKSRILHLLKWLGKLLTKNRRETGGREGRKVGGRARERREVGNEREKGAL